MWDLYGTENEPVVERRTLDFGAEERGPGSQAAYQRVNLRGLAWKTLLAEGPPVLWPLVALAGDGASEAAVHGARDAIEARADLSAAVRADHLAVLWFVAEAEQLPVEVMRAYISEEKLMESTLYQSAMARGETKAYAETIVRLLSHRMGALDPSIRERVRKVTDAEILKPWYEEALLAIDAEGAQRLAEKIRNAPLP